MSFSKRTLENLSGLNSKCKGIMVSFLLDAAPILEIESVTVEVLSGCRSWRQQAALYAQGRDKPGRIVTNAPPGSSWHNYGLAIDLGIFAGGRYLDETAPTRAARIYRKLAAVAIKREIEWAGNWKSFQEDCHFQWTGGRTLADLRSAMITNGFDVEKLPV